MLAIDKVRNEDWALMRKVAASDETAVTHLYDRFAPLVFRMANQSLRHRCDVDEVVQGVFVVLWSTAARYQPERAALVTWVMLITRRRIIDTLRKLRHEGDRSHAVARHVHAVEPDDSGESQELFARVVKRMAALNELQRTVLTRAYLRGQTLRQIGEDLNTPLGTVKTALYRGIRTLRADLLRETPAVLARVA